MEKYSSRVIKNKSTNNNNNINNNEESTDDNNLNFPKIIYENGHKILNYLNNFCKRADINEEKTIDNFDQDSKNSNKFNNNNINRSKNINRNNNIKRNNNINKNNNINRNNNINKNNNINNNNINIINNNIENNNEQFNENNINTINNNNICNESITNPLMSSIEYKNLINQSKKKKIKNHHTKRSNLFSVITDVFKDFFNDDEDNKNINVDNKFELRHRPILKRIIEKDILSPFKDRKYKTISVNRANTYNNPTNIITNNLSRINTYQNNNNQISRNNNIRNINSFGHERRELFSDDIITSNISEENNENIAQLVSYIPVFRVKKKIKSNESNNSRCSICLCDFEIGEVKSTLPCLHSFHCFCIEQWIKRKKYCPICKFQISINSLKNNIDYDNYKYNK